MRISRLFLSILFLNTLIFAGPLKPPKGMVLNQGRVKGLVGHWLMNEGSGNTIFDLSGNGNTATPQQPLTPVPWTSGKYGPALNFTGGANIFLNAPLVPNTGSVSIVVYFKVNTYVENAGLVDAGFATDFMFRFSTNQLQFYIVGANIKSVKNDFDTDVDWHQAVAVYDQSNKYIYIDGVLDNSSAETDVLGGAVTMKIGSYANNDFTGDMSHLLLYNRALSPSEILKRYKNPFMDFQPEPPMTYMGSVAVAAPAGQVIMIQMSAIPLVLIIGCVLIFSKGKKAT